MFRNWGFLLTEIWVLLALAALLGLFAGWLIWGRRPAVVQQPSARPSSEVVDRDRQIAALRASLRERDQQVTSLEADLADCRASKAPAAAAAAAAPLAAVPSGDMSKPLTLDGPRGGQPDDLKRIKGVGQQLERLCNKLGFYHFDQIAAWTPAEVAWVDQNLTGFTGRVTRDDWIAQAKVLAAGGETEFSQKVDKGEVYKD